MNEFLSTGQIAAYCGVHLRTVIRWIEQGYLKGYKLPGRGNNRVEKADFLAFLTAQNMPIPDALKPANPRALVIEDDVSMAKVIMLILQSKGWETLYAADGFQAGLTLAKTPVDLITLDLLMPNIDGFSVLAQMKENESLKQTPVLVISSSSEGVLEKALAAGANATLAKPFEPEALMQLVDQLMGKNQQLTNLINVKKSL